MVIYAVRSPPPSPAPPAGGPLGALPACRHRTWRLQQQKEQKEQEELTYEDPVRLEDPVDLSENPRQVIDPVHGEAGGHLAEAGVW